MKSKKFDLGVQWYAVNKKTGEYYEYYKRPFASTTVADSDSLKMFADDGYTWRQAQQSIPYPSEEMKTVIQRFVDDGYGESKMSEFIR